jgi:hypothetical protein
MALRRQVRLPLILFIVLGAHLIVVWLIVSSPGPRIRKESHSLQLLWIARPALSETAAPERRKTPARADNTTPRHRADPTSALPSIASDSKDEDNAIRTAPDWTEELKSAAKDVLANELAQKRHESDFAHKFPALPKKAPQFAWNYAATHRIEAMPEGGILLHLSDNCVLILFPLPLVGCGIGKRPANGDLFEHMRDQ